MIQNYSFTVYNDNKNPVPYKRTTQKQKIVDKEYHKYCDWKNKIVATFATTFNKFPSSIFKKDIKYYVDIVVYFKDKKHGDTDNIAKGINDAIFDKPLNDKYVAGSYDFFYDKKNPRVEVNISTEKNQKFHKSILTQKGK